MNTVSVDEFAALLKEHIVGAHWEGVPVHKADPDYYDCEACGVHPLTQEHADFLNGLHAKLRAANAPSPVAVYPWCSGELFIEWISDDEVKQNRAVYDSVLGETLFSFADGRPSFWVKVKL